MMSANGTPNATQCLLHEMRIGQHGSLERIDLPEDVSDHLAHLGFLPGAEVEVLRSAPAGDPRIYRIDGVEVALRHETARHIGIELSKTNSSERNGR